MSRSQWCCLVAALAVVLGLFCGPFTGGAAAAPASASVSAPASVSARVPVVADIGDDGHGVPGCGRNGKRDGTEPAVPGRARTAHDQAPGLAEWGLPAAVGPEPVRSPAPKTPRGPDAAAPGPVELSVLRV
uniref:Secreted protein n=1 Tax=Streptomyces sp. NBC_00008 TaxID=2903610 RepID=A0AAU2VRM8_9ACTN